MKQSKLYEAENNTPLMDFELETPRLHVQYFNYWTTGMWHFPLHCGFDSSSDDVDIFAFNG